MEITLGEAFGSECGAMISRGVFTVRLTRVVIVQGGNAGLGAGGKFTGYSRYTVTFSAVIITHRTQGIVIFKHRRIWYRSH